MVYDFVAYCKLITMQLLILKSFASTKKASRRRLFQYEIAKD
jgi:hypothetical protein